MADKIFGWFADQNRASLEALIAEHNIKTVLEIGSFLGLSTAWFAERVDHITCIDKFEEFETEPGDNNLVYTLRTEGLPNPFRSAFQRNMDDAGVAHKISVIQEWSAKAAKHVGRFDLIYIDGNHSYDGITADIELYLPKARKVICGDDYTYRFPGILRATRELLPDHKSNGPFWWKAIDRIKAGVPHDAISGVSPIARI